MKFIPVSGLGGNGRVLFCEKVEFALDLETLAIESLSMESGVFLFKTSTMSMGPLGSSMSRTFKIYLQ